MSVPDWSARPATYDDVQLLASIVLEATKHRGLWPTETTSAEERDWFEGFAQWSRETVDESDTLEVIEVDREPVGRLRIERDSHRFGRP